MAKDTRTSAYMRNAWVETMTDNLARIHPEMSRDDIMDFVIETYVDRFTDHECSLYNSYENTVMNSTLGGVCDWIDREKPLIAESGVFFYPKDKKRNVNIEIIKEAMLDARKIHKKEKFAAMDAGDTFTAAVKDLQQANDKKAANSGYGAEGQSSSFLFNINSAMSVTASGRGELSTAMCCFENLLADNVKFWSMDEFHNFIGHVVDERTTWKHGTFDVIDDVPSRKSWIRRFEGKFLHHTLCDSGVLGAVYDSLDDELRARTYYKCNLREFFLRNELPTDIYTTISYQDEFYDKKGNRVDFVDPNEVPKEIRDDVDRLVSLVVEFVNYKYSQFRYQDRARYMRRRVVIVADTDS